MLHQFFIQVYMKLYVDDLGTPRQQARRRQRRGASLLALLSALLCIVYSNMKLPIFILKLLINSPYSTHLGQVKYEEHFDYSRSRVVSSSWSDN